MKYLIATSFLFLSTLNSAFSSQRFVVNKIIARVNYSNILLSALQEPQIEKGCLPGSLEEIINDELLCQKAAEIQRTATPSDIERHLTAFKIYNNLTGLTDEEFDKALKQAGLSTTIYKKQLAKSITCNGVRQAEIDTKVVVTAQEVEDYWQKNPEYSKEEYHLKIATLDKKISKMTPEKIKKKAIWKDLGWFERHEINRIYAIALDLQEGEISNPINNNGLTQIIHLVAKKERTLKSLESRYQIIEKELKEEKRKKLSEILAKELLEKATIVYL